MKLGILRSSQGFSMVQVMLAAGIMGGLAVFMMKMVVNNQKAQKKVSHDSEIQRTVNIIENILAVKENCRATFAVEPGEGTVISVVGTYGFPGSDIILDQLSEISFNEIRISRMKELFEDQIICGISDKPTGAASCWQRFDSDFSVFPCRIKGGGTSLPTSCGVDRPYLYAKEGAATLGALCARLCGSRDGWSWKVPFVAASENDAGTRIDSGLHIDKFILKKDLIQISQQEFIGDLRIIFARNQKVATGAITSSRDIPITFSLDNKRRIISCYAGPCCGKD